jgi:hypothetical protein
VTPREELIALRRMAELEAKASGAAPKPAADPQGMFGWGQRSGASPSTAASALGRGAQLAARSVNNAGMGLINTFVADPAVSLYNTAMSLKPKSASDLVTGGFQPAKLPSERFSEWQNERIAPPQDTNESYLEGLLTMGMGAAVPMPFMPKASLATPAQNTVERRARKLIQETAGNEGTRSKLREALLAYKPTVSGVNPTSAEVVKGMPEGSPIQALQETVARIAGESYGQPSVEFGRRFAANTAAREAAKKALGKRHGSAREKILENANQFSGRLRNLASFITDREKSKASALQDAGRFETTAAEQTRRSVNKDAPIGQIGRKLGLAKDSVSYPSQATGATARPPAKFTAHAARVEEAIPATEEAKWIADVRQLEAAGAELEKELLENTGLVSLGPESLVAGAKSSLKNPKVYASEIASKTYKQFVDDIEAITQPDGTIDAVALDTMRKEFSPKLARLFSQTGWDTKQAAFAKAMRSAESFIDDAIEAAGGHGYKDELKRYSDGMRAIEDDTLRFDEMYKTVQPTNVPLARAIDDQVTKNIKYAPGLLNWKITAAKRAVEEAMRNSEPRIVAEISKFLRNPEDLAMALDSKNTQKLSSQARSALASAMKKYAPPVASGMAAQQGSN